jgi:hypothetical protein
MPADSGPFGHPRQRLRCGTVPTVSGMAMALWTLLLPAPFYSLLTLACGAWSRKNNAAEPSVGKN